MNTQNGFVPVTPSNEDRAAAKKLVDEGWLPVSNQYHLLGFAPAAGVTEELARLYNHNPGVAHWSRLPVQQQREHLARMTIHEMRVSMGLYLAIKRLVRKLATPT